MSLDTKGAWALERQLPEPIESRRGTDLYDGDREAANAKLRALEAKDGMGRDSSSVSTHFED